MTGGGGETMRKALETIPLKVFAREKKALHTRITTSRTLGESSGHQGVNSLTGEHRPPFTG